MNPGLIQEIKESDALDYFCKIYHKEISQMKPVNLHDGAANLYYYVSGSSPAYLRISYRMDRPLEMIKSELNFLNYLADNQYNSPKPIRSIYGNLCETYQISKHTLIGTLFEEIKGLHLYEKDFMLPQGVSLTQFWQHCGKTLGRLHSLSHQFQLNQTVHRFTWLDRHEQSLSLLFPENPKSIDLLQNVIKEIRSIPQSPKAYGLCHNDFNVCNFLIDYESKDFEIKMIDFDDSGFNYYLYDLVCFWEMCTGWAINIEPAHKWQEFMHRCFSTMLEEYHKHFNPDFDAIKYLPVFLKAVHLENILEPMRELYYSDQALIPDKEILYHLHCLENNIEYLGLFDQVFNPEHPFSLE